MNQFRNSLEDKTANERLSESLLAIVQYIPALSILVAIGFFINYLISQAGLIGNPSWQMLMLTGVVLFVAATHWLIIKLARNNQGVLAYWLYSFVMILTGLLFVLFWQSILIVAILIVWIPPVTLLALRMRQYYLPFTILVSVVISGLLFWLNGYPFFERLSANNPAAIADLIILASTVILFVWATIIARLFNYRTLQNRLVYSFVFIIAVPTIFITAISVSNAFTNSQSQNRDTLQALTSLKMYEMDVTAGRASADLNTLKHGSDQNNFNILYLLNHRGMNDQVYQINNSLASVRLHAFIVGTENRYEEVLVLDPIGKVILSSIPLDEGLNLGQEPFFQKGSAADFAGLNKFPGKNNLAGDNKFILAGPFYGSNGVDIKGVVVLIAKSDVISSILTATSGLAIAETYLVDESLKPITSLQSQFGQIRSADIINIVKDKNGTGSGVYLNYAGVPVLGYYSWYPTLQVATVSEIPQSDVLNRALSTLLVGGLIGIITIFTATIAIISTSRTISEPISALAKTADQFSRGQLDIRANSDREDELGKLALTFNRMADQLQGVIGGLEKRVAERTQDLERQTLRLRTAAEVARDASSASNPDVLLERAATLIRERFNLYHTGIFILDDKKEFAVLSASPTEAGHKMLENNHRLRVGEQGIVGKVAFTGQPRIALDTGVDPVFFNNPLLPATRSEMALPLKTNEGMIGVLDIQSDQPEAFTQDDIAIMQVMADQLATAMERTRLLHQVETSLNEMEKANRGYTEQSWMRFDRVGHQPDGYKYDNVRLEPINKLTTEARTALETGRTVIADPSKNNSTMGQLVAVPIRLRGQTIGVVNLHFQYDKAPEKLISMVEQISERLSTSLENARLLENSQRSANKERVIGEITSKIGSSVNIKNVLQTAVEELGRALPGSDVIIQFQRGGEVQGQEKKS